LNSASIIIPVSSLRDRAILMRIFIPLLAALLLGLAVRPARLAQNLSWARQASETNKPRSAAGLLSVAAEENPWRTDLWEMAAADALAAGRAKDALTYLQSAAVLGELSKAAELTRGDALAQSGDQQDALRQWQQIADRYGPSAELYQRMADAQRQLGDFPALLKSLQSWRELLPGDAKALYQLGLVLAATQPGQALPVLTQAVQFDPSLAPAVEQIRTAINTGTASGNAAYTLLNSGRALGNLDQWDLAAEAFRQAIQLQPGYADAHAFLGEALQRLGQDGLPELQKALNLDPSSVLVQALQAVYWMRNGKPEMALVYLHAAADQEPTNPAWQAQLGDALVQMGDITGALSYYQRATQIAPQNSVYWRLLASFCVQYELNLSDVGLPAARQAVALAPEDPDALDVMGQLLYLQGDNDNALRFLQRAIKQDAQYAPAHLHLGLVYLQQGKMDLAYEEWSKAQSMAGEGPVGDQAQRLIKRYFP
jgi:tetratricopeptide (TPR) repeat protein